jgi:hypothetical protein
MVTEKVGSYRCVNSTIDLFPFVDKEERDGQNNTNYKNLGLIGDMAILSASRCYIPLGNVGSGEGITMLQRSRR